MENKNGNGVFLGVVGVATLVVAIVGATFAFFTASAGNTEDVTAEAYQFATTLTKVEEISEDSTVATGLIPLASAKVTNAVNANKLCIDKNGYDVCEVYEVTFTNSGTQAATLRPTLTVKTNGFTTDENQHLKIAFAETVTATVGDGAKGIGAVGSSLTLDDFIVGAAVDGEPTTKKVYYVVYLEEMQEANAADQAQSFSASVTWVDAAGGAQLTGTFE